MIVNPLRTLAERTRGVIGREPVDFEQVFLFNEIYPGDGFHMRGVKGALDIIFLDRDLGVVGIVPGVIPEAGTATAPPGTTYAAEVMVGGADHYGLKVGKVWIGLSNQVLGGGI